MFEVIGVAGIEGAYAKKSADKATFSLGVGLGLQGNLYLTKNLDLYIEPRISFYTNKFAGGETVSKMDALTSLSVGLTYNTAERDVRKTVMNLRIRSFPIICLLLLAVVWAA